MDYTNIYKTQSEIDALMATLKLLNSIYWFEKKTNFEFIVINIDNNTEIIKKFLNMYKYVWDTMPRIDPINLNISIMIIVRYFLIEE